MTDNSDEESTIVHQARHTKREQHKYFNTLACLVKALEGKWTTIDLRNDSMVCGMIAKVDGMMNVDMQNVIFCDSRGAEHCFDSFFISKRSIRYVHIPEGSSARELIETQLNSMSNPMPKKKLHTFKISRAKKYNEETIRTAFGESSKEK